MDPLAPLMSALHGQGRLRVWSLVITAFGDLVQHRGGQVSTARLGQLLGRVGVEQGALRTALSRLGRDGWVTSERVGRTSLYRLSRQGLESFAPATDQIYAPPVQRGGKLWTMRVDLNEQGRPDVSVHAGSGPAGAADCSVRGELVELSEAFRASLLQPAHHAALVALKQDLGALDWAALSGVEAAAARLLLIHRWRRIVLRFDEIAPDLMPRAAPLSHPRLDVARAYWAVAEAGEAWLQAADGGLDPMPEARGGFDARFGGPVGS